VQVEVRQERPDLLGAAGEQGQDLAAERLIGVGDPRPAQRDRAARHRQAPLLAVAVAIPGRSVDRGPARGASAAEVLADLLLEDALDEALHLIAGEGLQARPAHAGGVGRAMVAHGGSPSIGFEHLGG